jgi:hypothetical protein
MQAAAGASSENNALHCNDPHATTLGLGTHL